MLVMAMASCALGLTLALAVSAHAASTDFYTSFEAGQPQPAWTDTPETDASGAPKAANVDGRMVLTTIPGNITDEVVEVQANGDNPPNETKEKAVDGNLQTKWLVFESTGWIQVKLSQPETVVDYALTSANDAPGRDPQDWNLQGSNDGVNWTTLDSQTDQDFAERFQTNEYPISNDTAYLYYRLNITRNHGDGIVQLAELQLSTDPTPPPAPPNMRAFVDSGPTTGPNIKAKAGFTGLKALHFAGGHVGDGRANSYNKVLDVDIPVTRSSRLTYKLFPELTNGDLRYPSTYSAVDLAFSDGTYLSDLAAEDQQFAEVSPQGQGASKTPYANQWNFKQADIGAVAAGKTVKRILIGYDNPGGGKDTLFNGWVDDIRISGQPADEAPSHLADWAVTTRGTNSSGAFSRGNNFPATAVPHGFNFWTPMTAAGSMSWLYEYQAQNNADNLPQLQAFEASHEPSPWMGDRQTSSDVAFADAYVKGVRGFDARAAYDAALKNATVAPPGNPFDSNVGRKGLIESEFLGYTPNEVGEGVSWALDGFINDFGIANMADALSHAKDVSPAERARYREERVYFLNRAQDYVHMFDSRVGFFQGKSASGEWTTPPDEFDPRVWRQNGDYTETDGWNFAFHAPQDGQGLANLYGGRDKLAAKLDQFFSTPETAKFPGTYGGTIHEMLEARDVRMGQWGASNQVSHHIPYMYNYAGEPFKTQEKVREATRRLFSGSQIGQGYPGDEDNGEMSAWYVFSALGFYPLQMGSPYYAIGSPLFTKATVHLQNGHDLVISAPDNSPRNVYVQGLRVNARPYDRSYLSQDAIADGGTIRFDMGPKPSKWATTRNAAPPSITTGDEVPHPMEDAARPDQGEPAAAGDVDAGPLFDNDSSTGATVTGTAPWVGFDFDAKRHIAYYTLTSRSGLPAQDPSDWVVKGSDDGETWTTLDERQGETFRWRQQTRPFRLQQAGDFRHYRLEFTKPGAASLAEVELLSDAPIPVNPISADVPTTTARPGTTAPVEVTVHNAGGTPVSGAVTGSSPDGWTVTPASVPFGPIDAGGSQTVTLNIEVPADAALGGHTLRVVASTPEGVARVTASLQVIGDTIEFTPGTEAEQPWLVDPDGSQLDGSIHDGRGRFADNGSHFTYRFDLPADVTGGTLTLEIGNEYLVDVSTDGQSWRTVLREDRQIHNLSNLGEPMQTLDLNDLRGSSRTLYVRVGDSKVDDGWGGWLGHLTLEMTS